jgi:hypothetical protein
MSRNAQIDHVVSLSNAWQTGAAVGRRQAPQLRQRPDNLQATQGWVNDEKKDADIANLVAA